MEPVENNGAESKAIKAITYEYVRPNLPGKVKRKRKNTTVAIYPETKTILRNLKQPSDKSLNDVIKRLVGESQGVVKVDVIAIDNELPQLHTMIAQIGEDKDSVFLFDGQNLQQTTLEEINKLMKQPKSTFTMTKDDVERYILKRKEWINSNEFFDRVTEFMGTTRGKPVQ